MRGSSELTLTLQSRSTCKQQGLSIFGSAAERVETVHRDLSAAQRGRSMSGLWAVGQVMDGSSRLLRHLYLPLYPHVLEGVGLAVSVVKEELLPLHDRSLGEDPDAVVSVHHHHFSVAVGIN